jgi:hypothetical protein
MYSNLSRIAWLVAALLVVQPLTLASELSAQDGEPDCTAPKGRGGLIRGDQVPSGRVLQTDQHQPRYTRTTTPYIDCAPRKFYTPLPKTSVLTNCVRLSGGRMIIPTAPIVAPYKGGLSFNRSFGATQSNFGRPQSNFGSQRNFGSPQRNFGRPAVRSSSGK